MRHFQKLLMLLLLIAPGLSTVGQIQDSSFQIVDRIVGQVGGEIILLSDIKSHIASIEAEYGVLDPESRCLVIENLFQQKLMIHQAKLDSVVVMDAEVDAQLEARFNRILSQMNNDESFFEEYYGKSVAEWRRDLREPMKEQILTQRMQQEIMADVQATPAEVIDFYNRIPKDSLPYFNAEVEVSELVYTPPFNEEERQKAISRLEEVRKRIEEGESFEALAEIYSDDLGSAKRGGDLGYQKRGALVPEFEAAAYNLEVGEMSEIVESEYGFHLIRLDERLGQTIRARHILIKPELTDKDKAQAKALLDSIKILVEADSITFEQAVKEWGDENVRSYNSGGRMVNPQTGTSFFEVSELDSDVYFAIDELDEGEVSDPVPFEEVGSDFRYKLFYLHSRTKPHRASLKQDYSRIQTIASEAKRNRKFIDWLERKLQTTYVDYDPQFIDCAGIRAWTNQ